MKKSLFLVALAGLAMAGCVKNEVADSVKQSTPIAFDSPVSYSNVNTGTKASVHGEINSFKYEGTDINYTYPRNESFKIFAVEHTGNLVSWNGSAPMEFNGTAISREPNLDAWAPKKADGGYYYWPDEKKLSFAAFSPAELEQSNDVELTYGSEGFVLKNFRVNTNAAKQYDMLYSKRALNKVASDMRGGAEYYSGISIEFQHALSSIHFSVLKDPAVKETVKLKKIELVNVVNKGTFTENVNSDETTYASTPDWREDAATVSAFVSFTGDITFRETAQYVSAIAAEENALLEAQGQPKAHESHPLLLIPQTLLDDLKLKITYEVGEEVKTKTVQLNLYPEGTDVNPITEWEIGKRYTYRIVYGTASEFKDIIYFSPSTSEWIPVDVIPIVL